MRKVPGNKGKEDKQFLEVCVRVIFSIKFYVKLYLIIPYMLLLTCSMSGWMSGQKTVNILITCILIHFCATGFTVV